VESSKHLDSVPAVSMLRQAFFALQLFKEQVFSMNDILAFEIGWAFAVNRRECCVNKQKYEIPQEIPMWQDTLHFGHFLANHKSMMESLSVGIDRKTFEEQIEEQQSGMTDGQKQDMQEMDNLYKVWWHKFEQIRQTPNERQCVKFDVISNNLKRYFLEQTKELDLKSGKRRWTISFEEILTVYPNVKELHFMNYYRFDDGVLRRLITQIKKRKNPLRKVVFLYFDYVDCGDGSGMPKESGTFVNPDNFNGELTAMLEGRGWKLKRGAIQHAGYKIVVWKA